MNSPIQNRMNTVFVHVKNLKDSVKWYTNLLGQQYVESEVSLPVYNIQINHHTGLTLDAGPTSGKKVTPQEYPLFNFHTDDIKAAYHYVQTLNYDITSEITEFDDFSFFTIGDPDGHQIMICTG
ncbi:VOC family protein [Oceanobacillus piezotolerans]|uniref:VOC family protein n=1 Tax=Oceanobacillus piezotolerans TaxID=2448030 RepID=A0A498D232_9BACI|nr:VOC family protein [Oceanobacillus piezotolerans]RLL41308.1 VOC family protein [Oceanobacillus piezotolerans]